jgi:hypothetical protein
MVFDGQSFEGVGQFVSRGQYCVADNDIAEFVSRGHGRLQLPVGARILTSASQRAPLSDKALARAANAFSSLALM